MDKNSPDYKDEMRARKVIGDRIRQVRMLKEMKQDDLAKLLGDISISSVSAYEKGGLPVPDQVLEVVAGLAGLSAEDITTGSTAFEEKVGSKVDINDRKRIRSSTDRYLERPTVTIDILIARMNSFEHYFKNACDRLLQHRDELAATPLRQVELELLEGFRRLPSSRKKRVLEDIQEWLEATSPRNEDLFSAADGADDISSDPGKNR